MLAVSAVSESAAAPLVAVFAPAPAAACGARTSRRRALTLGSIVRGSSISPALTNAFEKSWVATCVRRATRARRRHAPAGESKHGGLVLVHGGAREHRGGGTRAHPACRHLA